MTSAQPVSIRGDLIRLGQFLKLADSVDQGSDVKGLLATDAVRVNGDLETRRGRQLRPGDIVAVGNTSYEVTTAAALEVPDWGDQD